MIGPGKYDADCETAFASTEAEAVVLIVFGGKSGSGFSAQSTRDLLPSLPAILRDIAVQIEVDNARPILN